MHYAEEKEKQPFLKEKFLARRLKIFIQKIKQRHNFDKNFNQECITINNNQEYDTFQKKRSDKFLGKKIGPSFPLKRQIK